MGIQTGLISLATFLLMLGLLPRVDGVASASVILVMIGCVGLVLSSIMEIFDLLPSAEERSAKAYRTTEALNKNKLKIQELAESKIRYDHFYTELCKFELPFLTVLSLCFKYRPVSSFILWVVPLVVIFIITIDVADDFL